ncbi:hypothetical protein [Engelhardtia mirabilis]|uniref:Cysteine dioxygenase type I n=1 Tax=Engelhardtia mirabilis TaxID=2528011 RepID=A0A518BL27_9BACT|nr:Cysteine dioxygenase type I [Planctomycetes bacterium Pla133]QDV01979.1 Cysteine dioxygenase type I [Planctomycetes bacterium Pla86]
MAESFPTNFLDAQRFTAASSYFQQGLAVLSSLGARIPSGRNYVGQPLDPGPDGEAFACRWAPEGTTAPHDHGGGEGLVLVQEGLLIETKFEFDGSELVPVERRMLLPGDITWLGGRDIHTVEAHEPSWSLHFYWGKGDTYRIFDPVGRVTHEVRDTGAWLPVDPDSIVASTPWS